MFVLKWYCMHSSIKKHILPSIEKLKSINFRFADRVMQSSKAIVSSYFWRDNGEKAKYRRTSLIKPPLGLSKSGLINEVVILMRLFTLKLTRKGLGTTSLISKVPSLMGWPDPEVLLYIGNWTIFKFSVFQKGFNLVSKVVINTKEPSVKNQCY